MKISIYQFTLFIALLLLACNHEPKKHVSPVDPYTFIQGPEQCFMAVFQTDSAFLKFKILPNGKVRGKLIIKYGQLEELAVEKNFYHGIIRGQFNTDTLFADYIFTNGAKRTLYKNAIALLKKNNKLMLGFGVTVNYLGSTWFKNRKAINFTGSRFQFGPGDCK